MCRVFKCSWVVAMGTLVHSERGVGRIGYTRRINKIIETRQHRFRETKGICSKSSIFNLIRNQQQWICCMHSNQTHISACKPMDRLG